MTSLTPAGSDGDDFGDDWWLLQSVVVVVVLPHDELAPAGVAAVTDDVTDVGLLLAVVFGVVAVNMSKIY